MTAYAAGIGHNTGGIAGRRYSFNTVVPVVFFLLIAMANRAGQSVGVIVIKRPLAPVVSVKFLFNATISLTVANMGVYAIVSPLTPVVTKTFTNNVRCRDFSCSGFVAIVTLTSTTVVVSYVTILGTGRILGRNEGQVMIELGDRLTLGVSAIATGVRPQTFLEFGRLLGNNAIAPVMRSGSCAFTFGAGLLVCIIINGCPAAPAVAFGFGCYTAISLTGT